MRPGDSRTPPRDQVVGDAAAASATAAVRPVRGARACVPERVPKRVPKRLSQRLRPGAREALPSKTPESVSQGAENWRARAPGTVRARAAPAEPSAASGHIGGGSAAWPAARAARGSAWAAGHHPASPTASPPRGAAIIVADPGWRRLVPAAERLAARAVAAAGGADSVVLDHDRAIQRLNARHRGRNKPTNVLSFPPSPGLFAEAGGDIILALGTVRREASAAGRPAAHHLAHLIVHGALHLRGHDHHRPGDARRMELAEARILHRLRVPNPWKRR